MRPLAGAPAFPDFNGAKAAFFCGTRLLACLRDSHAHLPWPGYWDLPGGGREADETPEACLLRELSEEFGLALPASRLMHRRIFPSLTGDPRPGIFFLATITEAEIAAIRFGNEGQGWQMMEVAEFTTREDCVPGLRMRLRLMADLYPVTG